jgi:8-oxo-dGTP diphosphatase
VSFDDWFRLSVHAVITDDEGRVLLLKASYGDEAWGLPGGALDPGETIHEGLQRECREELGAEVGIQYLSGVYSHARVRSHAFIFRCDLSHGAAIVLSGEHTAMAYVEPESLAPVQRRRVLECLQFTGAVRSASF